MASSFCGTDIMKCGSPSTVRANHCYLYSDTQVRSSGPTFNVVATELLMLGTSRNWSLHKLYAQLSSAHPPVEWWGPKEAATTPQSELRPFPHHIIPRYVTYILHFLTTAKFGTWIVGLGWLPLRAMKVLPRAGRAPEWGTGSYQHKSSNGKED